ncbi:hypothetical protein BDA96_03G229400 [Sorghum bicolor]|uniref:DUF1618 domain-containing protein n=1 Tax=Sorghum bicolor TaxID=4558 RepID=A0A921UN52_SORBI|nr:hypothetical protein BDA96_03G229400 [Sorghum bicolor]
MSSDFQYPGPTPRQYQIITRFICQDEEPLSSFRVVLLAYSGCTLQPSVYSSDTGGWSALLSQKWTSRRGQPTVPYQANLHSRGDDGVDRWVLDRVLRLELEGELERLYLGTPYCPHKLSVLAVRDGYVYFATSEMLHDPERPCWFMSLCLATMEVEKMFERRYDGDADAFFMPWPPCLLAKPRPRPCPAPPRPRTTAVAPRRGGGPAPLRPGEHGEHEDRRSPAPWSPEEDAKVKAYIEEHDTGGNWIALLQKIDRWRTWIFVVDFDVPMLINVQSAAHLLDRHVKDIVTESDQCSIEEFIPLLRERLNVLNPYVRQFLVGWITVLQCF